MAKSKTKRIRWQPSDISKGGIIPPKPTAQEAARARQEDEKFFASWAREMRGEVRR